MGHQGSIRDKVQAIEWLDSRIVAPVKAAMDASGEPYRILVLPDHPTPIRCRTHTADPVPYVIYDSTRTGNSGLRYTEAEAAKTGITVYPGHTLMDRFLKQSDGRI